MISRLIPTALLRSGLLLMAAALISPAMTPELAAMIGTSQQLSAKRQFEQAANLLAKARSKAAEQNDTYTEALILNQLGVALEREGKFLDAQQAFDRGISRLYLVKGTHSPDLVPALNDLANLLYESSQFSSAEALLRRSLAILSVYGPRDARRGLELALLAKTQLSEGRYKPAENSAEQSLAILKVTGHREDLPAAISYSVIGIVSDGKHALQRAEESLRNALTILQKHLDPRDYRIGEGLANLGLLYAEQGSSEATPLLEQAHATFQANSANNLFVRRFLEEWADFEQKAGRRFKARELKKEAKTLAAANSQTLMSQYTVDANIFR